MSRDTRLALARPRIRRGLWWAWLGGGLVYSAIVEAPRAIDEAIGLSGPIVPAVLGWLALGAGVVAYRVAASPRTAVLAALGPLVVSGIAPTSVVIAFGLLLSGLAGGWVVGSVCRGSHREPGGGPAAAGVSVLAAGAGLVLVPLSSLWMAGLAAVVLASRSGPGADQAGFDLIGPRTAPPSPDAVLEASGLAIAFGGRRVLDGASLTVAPGELVALVGGNGSGKSTLLRILAGHLLPDEGSLFLDGAEVVGAAPEALARLGITLASGSRPVFPDLTVRENLQIAAWITGGGRRARAERTSSALTRFPELASLANAPAGTLSGGEQRLLALAASLLTRPRVLLADEVTLGLSPKARRAALETLRRAADAGAAVLVVEHELRDLLPLSDRALVLDGGRLTETEDPLPTKATFIPGAGT